MLFQIATPFGPVYPYALMVIVGTVAFLCVLDYELRSHSNRAQMEEVIFPAIVISGIAALFSSVLFDTLFKLKENGGFVLGGSTFYGGLIGACISMFIILGRVAPKTGITRREWFDLFTLPMIIFHAFGRVGCFFGGCCYGRETDVLFGLVFPDNPDMGIYHGGVPCYPTQLFEVAALALIAVLVARVDGKFEIYLVCYATARFFIEFFRGDDRGSYLLGLSPAQVISVLIALISIVAFVKSTSHRRNSS